MTDQPDPADRDRWARLRFAIIGPLLAAPPTKGELQNTLRALSSRSWQHPITGRPKRFGKSTLERWFYAARRAEQDPVAALKTQIRSDAGRHRVLSPRLIEALHAQYRDHPSWSVQLHYDNLRALLGEGEVPSYATVRRYFGAQGLRKTPRRQRGKAREQYTRREVRSFEAEHTNALWHLDFHVGSRNVLNAQGTWAKPLALCIIDDRSRLATHVQWHLDETVKSLVHGFSQALMRRGLPRALLTDNGAAMLAEEFRNGLHALGILHETTLPYAAYQNGKQERLWATIEGRLMAMLEGVTELTLDLLNNATHAWIEHDYHQTRHTEMGCSPLERYRAGPDVGRECPAPDVLRRAFRAEATRIQRVSDGTVSLEGRRFEVPSRFAHLKRVQLRYARWDLSSVDLVDARSGVVLSTLYPLDKSANASGERRSLGASSEAEQRAPSQAGDEIPPLLKKLLADFAATGLPPPYLPEDDPTS
jgi:putative transposase